MKTDKRVLKKCLLLLAAVFALFAVSVSVIKTLEVSAKSISSELDYTFETVPVDSIEISADGDITEIQPRQSFTMSYVVNPWYTTTSKIFFDVTPQGTASVTEVSDVELSGGQAQGKAKITVSPDAEVGSTFKVVAGADGVESNEVEFTVSKIPVSGVSLSLQGTDDKLHIGKTRTVEYEFSPSYASFQDIRYELYGNGLKYIEYFDEETGTIKAKNNITVLDINSTVTIIAYSVDNPNAYDSVTVSLYMPTTIVEISATTPRGRMTADSIPLAVANSLKGDTVTLNTKINGVASSGLNYVIVKGQEYIVNGMVQSDGTFTLRPTSNWSEKMKIPHPEIKIKAAYSDGYDEISISVYIPVEKISFINSVPTDVENYRAYDLQAEAFPKYATQLADNSTPINYSLNGLSSTIAEVDADGRVVLPKSLTSKGSVINFTASLVNEWQGVDVAPLEHKMRVVPVYAAGFKSITISEVASSPEDLNNGIRPSDVLQVEVEYTIDNVTDVDFVLSENSNMLSTSGALITIADLKDMEEDNPYINVVISYNKGSYSFSAVRSISVYVPAINAHIADAVFNRDQSLNLNNLIKINGHGFASDKTIIWGNPTVSNCVGGISAECDEGTLTITSYANAGTEVCVPYKTRDKDEWQYKKFTVAPLKGMFTLEPDATFNGKKFTQLETGKNIDLVLKFNEVGAATKFGVKYSVQVSGNAYLNHIGSNDKYDLFNLSAKLGQSGKNNYINYIITIQDGTAVYCVHTNYFSVPPNAIINCQVDRISIFKRISGVIGVSNKTFEVGDSFDLTGWNENFTFNRDDLQWTLAGGKMDKNKVLSSGTSNVYLKISADQNYNGNIIPFSANIIFSCINYYSDDGNTAKFEKSIYLKENYSLYLDGRIFSRAGYIQAGWSDKLNGSKVYSFGETYFNKADIDLYAYWVRTSYMVSIGEDQKKTLDENQNKDIFTDEYYIDLNFNKLRELGYTKVTVNLNAILQRTVHSGNHAKIWMELNGTNVLEKDDFEPKDYKYPEPLSVTLDISKFADSSKVKLGFYTDDDGKWGKFTWVFYSAKITFNAIT